MRVVVGSTNRVKIGAVETVFRQYYPDCIVVGVAVESGVAEQPMSEIETISGARERARAALISDDKAAYGVGVEGGVMESESGLMYSCAWVCVIKKSQIKNSQILKSKSEEYTEGLGGGLYFELPRSVAEGIRKGGELGPLMDQLTGEVDNKHKAGAIGVFTQGKLDRREAYTHLVHSAIIKFVSPGWFV